MKLATKFGVLIGLLGLTVVVSLGAALLFARLLETELRSPLVTTTSLLDDLSDLKLAIGAEADRLFGEAGGQPGRYGNSSEDEPEPAGTPGVSSISQALQKLQANSYFESRLGRTLASNITQRTIEAQAAGAELLTTDAGSAERTAVVRAAADGHMKAHELIERVEKRIVKDSVENIDHGDQLRGIFLVIVAAAMTASALFALLGSLLFRRWVVGPVGALRLAAEEIGAGRFSHRVPVLSDDELGRLSSEVNHMAGMIASMQQEAVERERLAAVGEMVRRLAHNLRNPLSGIRGLAELTRMRAPEDEAIRHDQSEIITAVDRFNGWLTDLLQATSPLALNPREMDVQEWLTGVIDSHRPLARMRSVTLDIRTSDAPKTAHFDPKHLEHAVVAILTNAIQASPPESTVVFEARMAEALVPQASPTQWEIRIADQGSGIAPEVMSKIFKPYFTTKRDGNGIGLAVAQSVVKGHGGRIDVRSEPGLGAEFIVRIPTGVNGGNQPARNSHSAESDQTGARSGQHTGH